MIAVVNDVTVVTKTKVYISLVKVIKCVIVALKDVTVVTGQKLISLVKVHKVCDCCSK